MDLVVDLPSTDGQSNRSYCAIAKLGGGSFGDILAAVATNDPQDWVALKIEARYRANDPDRRRAESSMVRFEHRVCRTVARVVGKSQSSQCPAVRACISLWGEHEVLAMELLGPNLRDYATALGKWPLPEDLVLVLGALLVGRLEQLHNCGFVHRDLKPENLALRLERSEDEGAVPCFLLVDYALAMSYARVGGADHVPLREDAEVVGTHRYMAVHAQKRLTQSRRSDLESLAHVLVYLALGQLPWQNVQDISEMLQRKEQTPPEEVCDGLCPAFTRFLKECRSLGFDTQPNYIGLQRMLLEGVTAPVDFEAARVRHGFKQQLREAYLRHQAARPARSVPPTLPMVPGPVVSLPHALPDRKSVV